MRAMTFLKSASIALLAGLVTAGVGGAVLAAETDAGKKDLDMWDKARLEVQGKLDTWGNLKEQLFPERQIADGSDLLSLQAPDRAVDAALVPVKIEAAKPQSEDSYIKTVYLVIDENPSPVAAVFHLTPKTGVADLSTRVRVDKYTHVRAIAETSDGKLHMVQSFVKASGGCSAPGLSDKEAAMARLGKMKMKVIDAPEADKPGTAQLLVSHPNFTGLQYDQVKRMTIPAHYVDKIDLSYGDEPVLSVESDISISENPTIRFHYTGDRSGELEAVVTDSEGNVFKKAWPVSPRVEG